MSYRNKFLLYSSLVGIIALGPIEFFIYRLPGLFTGIFVLISFLIGCAFDYAHSKSLPMTDTRVQASPSTERAWVFIKKGGMWGLMFGIWINFIAWFICFIGGGCGESMILYYLLFLVPFGLIVGITVGIMCLNRITKIIAIVIATAIACYFLGYLLFVLFIEG